jgi:murein DD-endopeptidase MepM/ murein hydrolase activator NlpD
MHEGLDIGSEIGKQIIAPADGLITFSGHKAGFGNFLELDHGYGIETVYAHADKLLVRKGERIKRGALIAKVGNTGYSTGPHLHYEVRVNGTPVDPMYYILD